MNIEQLKDLIKTQIEKINDTQKIKTLKEQLTVLRKSLDRYDGFFGNIKDAFKRKFAGGDAQVCILNLYDIVDTFPKYEPADKQKTIVELTKISAVLAGADNVVNKVVEFFSGLNK